MQFLLSWSMFDSSEAEQRMGYTGGLVTQALLPVSFFLRSQEWLWHLGGAGLEPPLAGAESAPAGHPPGVPLRAAGGEAANHGVAWPSRP